MAEKTPTLKQQINLAIAHAHHAVSDGAALRRRTRRRAKPGAPNRQEELLNQLDQIAIYGNDLRRLGGKIQWGLVDERDEGRLKAASAEIDAERRKLRKMLR